MTEKNLRDADVDRLGRAVLSLARELWVTRDRQLLLEAALAEAGIIPQDLLDRFQPDDNLQRRLGSERANLIDSVLQALEMPGGVQEDPPEK